MANKQSNRREEAREKARLLREQQAKRERRNRGIMIGVVVLLLALVAAAIWAIVSQGSKSVIEGLASDQIPKNTQVADGGIPVGKGLVAGQANEGAPTVDVYLDYTCHYCQVFEEQHKDYLNKGADSGDIDVVYHPVAILDRSPDKSEYSGRAAAAAATVADQAPDSFVKAHEALLAMGKEYTESQGQADLNPAVVAQRLQDAGVPAEVAKAASESTFADWVDATTQQFGRDGYTGTPTIVINGTQLEENWAEAGVLEKAIDDAR